MPPSPSATELPPDALRGFPEATVRAVRVFHGDRTRVTLEAAVRAVLEFYLPQASRRPLAGVPGVTRLREDLGIDSLALAEAVFKWDELFATAIETREAAGVRSLEELVEFLAAKMGLEAVADPAP